MEQSFDTSAQALSQPSVTPVSTSTPAHDSHYLELMEKTQADITGFLEDKQKKLSRAGVRGGLFMTLLLQRLTN